eukprot:1135102-Lingulodinium_polyedra.AAC.1
MLRPVGRRRRLTRTGRSSCLRVARFQSTRRFSARVNARSCGRSSRYCVTCCHPPPLAQTTSR